MAANRSAFPSPALIRLAGAAYLAIFVCGIFAEFGVRQRLIVPGDAAATAAAVSAAETLFRRAMAAELVMLLADVFLAAVIYVLLRPVHRTLAALAGALRLVHAAVVAAGLLQLFLALKLAGAADPVVSGQALTHLETHAFGYAAGLVFFGLHCLVLGGLILRSALVPRILGGLLVLAGAGYLIDGFANTLLTDYAARAELFQTIVFVPAFVGELAFCLWLLVKGAREP